MAIALSEGGAVIDKFGLLVVHDPGGTRWSGRLRRSDDPKRPGAVFGTVSQEQADRLLERLRSGDDPGRSAQDLPWAAAAVRSDGTLAITCSTMLRSGLFWSLEPAPAGRRIVAATDPLSVARAKAGPVDVDDDFLHGFLLTDHAPARTPMVGIQRLAPGITLVLDPRSGSIRETEWCGPDTLPPPTLRGDQVLTRYRDTFDEVVAGLVRHAGPVVATVSGGLDSTFLAASLATVVPDGPVTGYCYRPLPQARARPRGRFDPDDFPLARLMAERYPGTLSVEPLTNDDLIHPLDAAEAAYRASGWPEYAAAHSWWLNEFAARAARRGSALAFWGINGNPAFSYDHPYAAAYYLRRARFGAVAGELLRSPRGTVRGLLAALHPPEPNRWALEAVGLVRPAARGGPSVPAGRRGYLCWLTDRIAGLAAARNPAHTPGVLPADPFISRSVLELAAAIEPAQWRRGPGPRALARRLGAGRVPDPIRLRQRRGGQDGDVWYLVRNLPGRLRADVEQVLDDAAFADLLDRDAVRAWLDSALATPATAPGPPTLPIMLRLISVTQYRAWLRETLVAARPGPPEHITLRHGLLTASAIVFSDELPAAERH